MSSTSTTVGWAEIDGLKSAAMLLKRRDMSEGGGSARVTAALVTEQAERALSARLTPGPSTRRNMAGERDAAAALAFVNAGFTHHDAGDPIEAFRLWGLAEDAVAGANNWSLCARLYCQQARQHVALGQAGEAVDLLTKAIEGDRFHQLNGTDKAMLYSMLARALAYDGHEKETVDAVHRADLHMYDRPAGWKPIDDAGDRPWLEHYGIGHHMGDTGAAMRTLTMRHGFRRAGQAIGLYELARDRADRDKHQRTDVLVTASLAGLQISEGEVDEGVRLAHEALNNAHQNQITSNRVIRRWESLIRVLAPYKDDQASALRERLQLAIAS